ncbi:cytochrome P450 98A3 [Daedaleopsis nitida]|nr:cytochrome P450 98A3 [Daedaleopsis nitida]
MQPSGTGAWPWVISSIVVALVVKSLLQRRARRLPPGPTPLPIVGNLFHMPRKDMGRELRELSNTYGDVVHLNVFGQSIILLGSAKVAYDLLDKRSSNYSNRPKSAMITMAGFDTLFTLMDYGPDWRQHRRAFHSQMHVGVVQQYESAQLDVTRNLLRSILSSPQDLKKHVEFTFAVLVLHVTYGIDLHKPNDGYFHMVERLNEVGEEISVPGRYAVEAFPWMRHIPSWLPGAGFKKLAAKANDDLEHTADHFFNNALTALDKGDNKDSFVGRLLENVTLDTPEGKAAREVCRKMTLTTYTGEPISQTNALVGAFFLALVLYPDVQKKAQAELDAVVGRGRLPDFNDRDSLPYITAIVTELSRWHNVTPIGLPHSVAADDEYNGYIIPGGATVMPNIWALTRDPELYPDPDRFIPERFLDEAGRLDVKGRDPGEFVFGFGRRVCPGRHFAESLLFVICASLVWAFDISAPVDEEGNPVELKHAAPTNVIVS